MQNLKRGTTICTVDELCFPVELIDNPNKTNREYSKIVVGEVDGEDMDLNYCSPRYELVPNDMIFPSHMPNSVGLTTRMSSALTATEGSEKASTLSECSTQPFTESLL